METEQTGGQESKHEPIPDKEHIVIKKHHISAVIGAVVIVSFFIFAAQAVLANADGVQQVGYKGVQAAAAAPLNGEKQVIKLSAQGVTYYPNPVRLKKGVPAVLEVDTNSVQGCLRGIQIPAFGIRKLITSGDNKIEFTPDKAGTFGLTCFMGMGKGQIVVEDEKGNVPSNVNTVAQDVPAGGGSCGAGGGGCGCGGG